MAKSCSLAKRGFLPPHHRKTRLALLFTAALGGCTSFTGTRVDLSKAPSEIPHGILVPDEVPLLVISNGVASIVMVRSADRGSVLQFSAFLAKHDVELDFNATGGLGKIISNQDATALPLSLVDLAKSVAEKLPAGLGLSKSESQSSAIQIYRIRFENGEVVELVPLLNEKSARFVDVPYNPVAAGGTPIEDVNDQAGAGDKPEKPADSAPDKSKKKPPPAPRPGQ